MFTAKSKRQIRSLVGIITSVVTVFERLSGQENGLSFGFCV